MKRMITRKPFSKMAGLTLLETMFALAVGALVLIGAVVFYMSTKQSGNTNKVVGDMNAIVSAIGTYTSQNYDINTLTGALGGALGKTPLAVLQSKGYLPNPLLDPWGQEYTVKVTSSGKKAQATITIPGISSGDKNCNAIATTVAASGATAATGGCAFTYNL